MPGDRWQQLATLRAYLAFMWAHPGKQLIFMGAELGQESEWAESRELDWWLLDHPEHLGMHRLVKDLNAAYRSSPAIWSRENDAGSFQWIDANDTSRNTFSFLRRGSGSPDLVCVSNFAAIPHADFRLGMPAAGEWHEVRQHRRRDLLRLRGRQPRVGHGPRGRRERTARPRDPRPAPARDPLAPPYLTPTRRWSTARRGSPEAGDHPHAGG